MAKAKMAQNWQENIIQDRQPDVRVSVHEMDETPKGTGLRPREQDKDSARKASEGKLPIL